LVKFAALTSSFHFVHWNWEAGHETVSTWPVPRTAAAVLSAVGPEPFTQRRGQRKWKAALLKWSTHHKWRTAGFRLTKRYAGRGSRG